MNSSDTLPSLIVTGSSGFIGAALIHRVAERFRVFGLDRQDPAYPPPVTEEVIECDISSDESVAESLRKVREIGGNRIASVIHLAAYCDLSGEPSPLYDEITVHGTMRLLRALRSFEVEQFIFSSTMLVHAPCQPGDRIREDSPVIPTWEYPKSKARAEGIIEAEHHGIPDVIMRIAGVYDDYCHSMPIAHQIERIYNRRMISHVYPGDLNCGQAFVHLDDLIDAIERAIDRRNDLPKRTVLLIGESETLSYGELQEQIAKLLYDEESWGTQQIPKAIAKTGAWLQDVMPGEDPFIKPWMIDRADDHFALDTSRARDLLGWQTRKSLRQFLPVMIQHLKHDPVGWFERNNLLIPEEAK